MNSTAASWRVSSTSTSESCGRPALARPSRSAAAMAMLERIAPDDPRRNAALPGLEAQAEGVARDVGAVLVDDRHDAERHPHPVDPQAVRAHPAVGDLAHRVGQPRDRRAARWPSPAAARRTGAGGRRRWAGARRPRRRRRRRRWRPGSPRGGRGGGRRPRGGRRPSPRWRRWPAPDWPPWRGHRGRRWGRGAPRKCTGRGPPPSHPDPAQVAGSPHGHDTCGAAGHGGRPRRHGRGAVAVLPRRPRDAVALRRRATRVRCGTPGPSSRSRGVATSSTRPCTRPTDTRGRPTGIRPATGSRRPWASCASHR